MRAAARGRRATSSGGPSRPGCPSTRARTRAAASGTAGSRTRSPRCTRAGVAPTRWARRAGRARDVAGPAGGASRARRPTWSSTATTRAPTPRSCATPSWCCCAGARTARAGYGRARAACGVLPAATFHASGRVRTPCGCRAEQAEGPVAGGDGALGVVRVDQPLVTVNGPATGDAVDVDPAPRCWPGLGAGAAPFRGRRTCCLVRRRRRSTGVACRWRHRPGRGALSDLDRACPIGAEVGAGHPEVTGLPAGGADRHPGRCPGRGDGDRRRGRRAGALRVLRLHRERVGRAAARP